SLLPHGHQWLPWIDLRPAEADHPVTCGHEDIRRVYLRVHRAHGRHVAHRRRDTRPFGHAIHIFHPEAIPPAHVGHELPHWRIPVFPSHPRPVQRIARIHAGHTYLGG